MNKKNTYVLLAFIASLLSTTLNGQVKIGGDPTQIDPSAILDLESDSKGFLPPRMTAAQRDLIHDPTGGMIIFNTTKSCMEVFNSAEGAWKSLCGDESDGSATYTPDCTSLSVQGLYYTGTPLNPQTNTITLNVNVSEVGTYAIITQGGGMVFVGSGTFTNVGVQTIVLSGKGYPSTVGTNFLAFVIGSSVCNAVIYVANGLSVVSACGTPGTQIGTLTAGTIVAAGDVQVPLSAIAYTGGTVFGLSTSQVNGIYISSPLQSSFSTASPATADFVISGTPLVPGNTVIPYSINDKLGCTLTVPVTSGTGRASAVACTGTLSGTYQVGTALTATATKVISLTVSAIGTFTVRTNTVNGIYFQGSLTATATGVQNVTLTAYGTPLTPDLSTYTVTVSSAATTFVTCTFTVTPSLPVTIPAYNNIACATNNVQYQYIKASNTTGGDEFYQPKMSYDGLTLVVAAAKEDGSIGGINSVDNNTMTDVGAVYVYTRTSLTALFTFQAKIKPSNPTASDYFGVAIDLSNDGNTLVVGASGEDGGTTGVNPVQNNLVADAGAVYVYTRSGTNWTEQAYIKAPSITTSDKFGTSVAISGDGNVIAVGVPFEDGSLTGINPAVNELAANAGAVYTYTRSGSTWVYDSYIKPSNTGAGDNFGEKGLDLNLNGTTLVVTAPLEDGSNFGINPLQNNSAANSGAVYVFLKTGSTWAQQAYIKASNTGAEDQFGSGASLSDDGNVLVVAAIYEDGGGLNVNPGDNNSLTNSGAVYVYRRTGTTWAFEAYLKASNTGASDYLGECAISQNGTTIVAGAYAEDGNCACVNGVDNGSISDAGAAYVYVYSGGAWVMGFKLKAFSSASSTSDWFGYARSLAVNGTGTSIAGGIIYEDGSATGINGTVNESASTSGAVRVFTP